MRVLAIGLLVSAAAARAAYADTCVVLDESRDTLAPEDRRAAQISMVQAFAKAGQGVGPNCTTTYTFYNVKLGATISVYVEGGPTGPHEARATKIDELPLVYEQIAHSIVTGTPMGSIDNVDRTNATADQMAPRRVAADGLKYVRLGYGAVTGKATEGGTAFGFGYRYELDQLAIDVSLFNMVWASADAMDSSGNRSTRGGLNGELVRIGALGYQAPLASSTMYYGGGLGYGINTSYDTSTDTEYSGSGLQATGVLGYEMLRASTIRFFVELDVTAPLYRSTADFGGTGNRWTPVASLTIGAGLGHSNTVNVVQR